MIEPRADRPTAITLGADKAYDAEDFVNELLGAQRYGELVPIFLMIDWTSAAASFQVREIS
jgi:hypothetical protein